MNNMEAIEVLRNTGQIVTLVVARVNDRDFEEDVPLNNNNSFSDAEQMLGGLSQEDIDYAYTSM